MSTERMINEWQDAAGGFLRSGSWVDSAGAITSLQTAVAASSNALLSNSTVAVPFVSTIAAVPNVTWYLCTDTAVLIFDCADGSAVSLVIPAPKQSMFKPNGLVVDPTSSDVVPIISAAIGTLANVAGSLVTAYSSGVRSSRRVEQNAPSS